MRHKKTKKASYKKNSITISQKKSNSKPNYLSDISKEKNNSENNNLEKSTNSFTNCIVLLEDIIEKNKVKCQEPVEKTIETFNNEQNKPKETPILKVHNQFINNENQFETKINKNKTNKMKTCSNAIQEKLTKMPKKTNTEIKNIESNQKQGIEKKSSKLPDNNEARLTEESTFVNVKELTKTKLVSFDENLNEIVQNKKKSNSKGPNGRSKCIFHAVYEKNINYDCLPNCQHKRKLFLVKKMINNFHKRFKKNIL